VASPSASNDPADPLPIDESLPSDPRALQAEVLRLRETLRASQLEKERALRLLRSTNTHLFGRVQGQTQQLSQLNRLMNTINASLDLRVVAGTALSGLQSLMGVEAAALALVDSQGAANYFTVHPVVHMPALAGAHPLAGEGLVGRVLATGRGFVANDLAPAPVGLSQADRATGFQFRSVLCEPLTVRDHVIGVLELVNKYAGPFVDSDRAFVETVAGSLSVAIENARNYTEAQTRLESLERTHAELVETQAQLVQSAKLASIGQLAAGLAHEINNPIGIILGFAQLITQRTQDEKIKSFAVATEREAVRVRRIISDLLGFARQTSSEMARVDLRQISDQTLRLVEYQLGKDNIQVVRQYAAEPNWVMADSDQLLQVVMNLVQNARQAMPTGGQLTLRTWAGKGVHGISVADTGSGIAPDVIDHIFDPFFTTKPVGQGTGLGLSVSYGLIARLGGDIQVASQPGQGSIFTITLPQAAGPAATAGP
jgi:signal transduction histidine kinase